MSTIRLISIDKELCSAWRVEFKDTHDVDIIEGDYFSVESDVMVSPANSFGFMDGGLDKLISEKLGWHIQEKVQKFIHENENYTGELLVGDSFVVPTEDERWEYLMIAPTMRVPMILPKNTINPYLTSKAIFSSFIPMVTHIGIETINIPGLGTGVGKVPAKICARQMKMAYDEVWQDNPFIPKSWAEAQTHHKRLTTLSAFDMFKDLQFEE